jgi:hypothetical protein
MSSIYSNLADPRNHELRFAILNSDILPAELVKMTADQLAPTSEKNRRLERQEKYFKEQVLVADEAKIIAKTHKGEAILSVDQNPGDYYYENMNINQENSKSELQDIPSGEVLNSDEEKKIAPISRENSELNLNKKSSEMYKNSRGKDCPYKNLSKEDLNLYFLLEEYSLENLYKKWDEKLKTIMYPDIIQAIHTARKTKQTNNKLEFINGEWRRKDSE